MYILVDGTCDMWSADLTVAAASDQVGGEGEEGEEEGCEAHADHGQCGGGHHVAPHHWPRWRYRVSSIAHGGRSGDTWWMYGRHLVGVPNREGEKVEGGDGDGEEDSVDHDDPRPG